MVIIISVVNVPWAIIGDFNVITGAHEKKGGSLPSQISCDYSMRSILLEISFTWIQWGPTSLGPMVVEVEDIQR